VDQEAERSLSGLAQASARLCEAAGALRDVARRMEAGAPAGEWLADRTRLAEEVDHALRALAGCGEEFRAAELAALREAGLSMAELAKVFGVTRQRVSVLLAQAAERGGDR
jgi:DNA-directed RNA polymerase specialized sigma24 family protein